MDPPRSSNFFHLRIHRSGTGLEEVENRLFQDYFTRHGTIVKKKFITIVVSMLYLLSSSNRCCLWISTKNSLFGEVSALSNLLLLFDGSRLLLTELNVAQVDSPPRVDVHHVLLIRIRYYFDVLGY